MLYTSAVSMVAQQQQQPLPQPPVVQPGDQPGGQLVGKERASLAAVSALSLPRMFA